MKSSLFWFILTLLAIAGLTLISPQEQTLGSGVRIVYLHGAWVWTALAAFGAAALAGAVGLLTRRLAWHRWSLALGRTGLFFWITYLPLSMWASSANWNGLFLSEPRWRLAFIYSVVGLLLQLGLTLIDKPSWASAANIIFLGALMFSLATTERVLHPPSPIFTSDSLRIQLFFRGLLALTLAAAYQIAAWLRRRNSQPSTNPESNIPGG